MAESIVEQSFFKVMKYSRFDLLEKLSGVQQLTKYEIRKDLREIERSFLVDDTDSDSSVRSEDILQSSYPVKPRRMTRVSPRQQDCRDKSSQDSEKVQASLLAADEALSYLKGIRLSQYELYCAEIEREKLETTQLSYMRAIDDKVNRFGSAKKEQESYLQLLQAMSCKLLKQHVAYTRQNVMMYDLIEAIHRRRASTEQLDVESKRLKAVSQGKSRAPKAPWREQEGETAVLRVHLNGRKKEVVLHKGQWIKTPMGNGKIVCILPSEHSVTVKLSFGMMYCCLERLVCWGGVLGHEGALDLASEKGLTSSWNSEKFLSIPIHKKIGIRKLIGRGEEYEDLTDQDDDSSDAMVTSLSPPLPLSTDDTHKHGSIPPVRCDDYSFSQREREREGRAPSGNCRAVVDIAENDVYEKESMTEIVAPVNDSQGQTQGRRVFPLSVAPPLGLGLGLGPGSTTSHSTVRHKIRKAIRDDILSDAVDIRMLPVAFAPTASIATVMEVLDNPRQPPFIEYCKSALSSSDGGKVGSMSSLAWNGNVSEMKEALNASDGGIHSMETEVKDLIYMAQATGSRTLKLIKELSSVRLAIFTKRIRHRNNLGAHVSNAVPHSNAMEESVPIKRENTGDNHKASSSSACPSPNHGADLATSAGKKRPRDQTSELKRSEKLSKKGEVEEAPQKRLSAKSSSFESAATTTSHSSQNSDAGTEENSNHSLDPSKAIDALISVKRRSLLPNQSNASALNSKKSKK